MREHEFWRAAAELDDKADQRWGQALFNTIPSDTPGLEAIRGTLDDPFYRIKSKFTARRWFNEHVSVDCAGTILEVHP